MSSISFGALSKAQHDLELESASSNDDSDSDNSDSDDGPPEESRSSSSSRSNNKYKRHNKHAPAESSSKKPVSWIRDIPGLSSKASNFGGGSSGLYKDIRFDTAYGKADLQRARKNYAFLNEYRESELEDMRGQLKNHIGLGENDKHKLQKSIQSLESRMKTLKDRDFEANVLSQYKQSVKTGEKKGPLHLKRSDKRKLVLSEKFKVMKKKDVEKALERKRKKNTAKERRLMPTERMS